MYLIDPILREKREEERRRRPPEREGEPEGRAAPPAGVLAREKTGKCADPILLLY